MHPAVSSGSQVTSPAFVPPQTCCQSYLSFVTRRTRTPTTWCLTSTSWTYSGIAWRHVEQTWIHTRTLASSPRCYKTSTCHVPWKTVYLEVVLLLKANIGEHQMLLWFRFSFIVSLSNLHPSKCERTFVCHCLKCRCWSFYIPGDVIYCLNTC